MTQFQSSLFAPADRVLPPENGLRGLRHWRHDLLAGFVVSLVSLPLSSGIAIASGAPPIYGIISSIIAGLIFPFLGGSFVTISGPAAGLAPALMATMVALGGAGNADQVGAGYPLLLVVIFAVGIAQVIMAKLNLARFASIFPATAVEGMLVAIGLLILVKALPLFFGVLSPPKAHGFVEYVASIPKLWASRHNGALFVGGGTLIVMLIAKHLSLRVAAFSKIPPHIIGVAFAIPAALIIGLKNQDPGLFISVPANPLSGLTLPDFSGMAANSDLWGAALMGFVTLLLIDGVESLATAQAVDRIDPFKRRSVPSRVLMAMGISNVFSSLVGGLTVIPGGVKSKTCVEAGGRTLWANFANAVLLLGFLFIAPALIGLLSKSALGAILVYTGWRMAHPTIFKTVAHIGREQLVVFAITIAVTLLTDLLVGVLAGTAAKLIIVSLVERRFPARPLHGLKQFFQDPVDVDDELDDGTHVLHVGHPIVSFNAFRLVERVRRERAAGHKVRIEVEGTIVDHTSVETLHSLEAETQSIVVNGLGSLTPQGDDETSMRVAQRQS